MEFMINSLGSQVNNNGAISGSAYHSSLEKKFESAGVQTFSGEDALKGIMDIKDVKNLLYMMIGVSVKVESPQEPVGKTFDSVA